MKKIFTTLLFIINFGIISNANAAPTFAQECAMERAAVLSVYEDELSQLKSAANKRAIL